MNVGVTPETAREMYREAVEEMLSQFGEDERPPFLGLKLTGQTPSEAAEAVARATERPGALHTWLSETEPVALDLLVDLIDTGGILPPGTLQQLYGNENLERVTAAFTFLRAMGLVIVATDGVLPFLVAQPWARHLLAEKVEELRTRRFRSAPPLARSETPLRQLLALCLNHVRGQAVRVSARGQLYKRHRQKAMRLFEPIDREAGVPHFEIATTMLVEIGGLRIDADGFLEVVPARAREIVAAAPEDLVLEILGRTGGSRRVWLGALQHLVSAADLFPDGWTTFMHLHVLIEILQEGSSNREPWLQRDTSTQLVELEVLGLLRRAPSESGDVTWYRITALGRRVLGLIERASPTGEADPEQVASPKTAAATTGSGAIVQPNLDVLVPLDAPAEAHWWVGAFARLEAVDRMCRYTLEKEHAQAVFSREGHSAGPWLEAGAGLTPHGLPENVEQTLRSWLSRTWMVEVVRGTVLRVPTGGRRAVPDVTLAALADAVRKLKGRTVAPGVFIVPEGTRPSRLRQVLHRHGLCPDNDEEEIREPVWDVSAQAIDTGALRRILHADLEDIRTVQRSLADGLCFFDPPGLDSSPPPGGDGKGADAADPFSGGAPGPWETFEAGAIAPLLHGAVRRGLTVELFLEGAESSAPVTVRPHAVLRRGSRVYLTGLCVQTDEDRAYPLDRIERVRVVG